MRSAHLTLIALALSAAHAHAHPAHAQEAVATSAETDGDGAPFEEGTSPQYWNIVTLKVAHMRAFNQPRESADAGGHVPGQESLIGLVPSYGRSLIPGRLSLEIALPFFANTERFDTPIDVTLLVPYRIGRFEPYIAFGGTVNFKIFPGERGEAEGTGVEFVAGLTGGIGLAYIISEHWVAEIELTYAWIPTSNIVEHEFSQLLGLGYAF